MRLMTNTLITTLLMLSIAQAQEPPANFTFQGRILKANGRDPVEEAAVSFKVQIRSPDGLCMLFEETHIRDMRNTSGVFSLIIGQGTNSNASALNLTQVFNNAATMTGASSCVYAPLSRDSRRLRLTYDTGTEVVTLPMDQNILSVPFAMNSQTLQGLGKSSFLQTSPYSTQARVDAVMTYGNELVALASGTSAQYAKASDLPISSGTLDLSAGSGVKVPAPAGADYAVNKNYADGKVGGYNLNLTGITQGQTLGWNATLNRWDAMSLANGTVTSITAGTGLAGGTISSSGTISLGTVGATGTYSKVTTDAYGRVTSGSSLTSADIPTASGDVSGAFNSLVVGKLQGVAINSVSPSSGQVLTYNGATSKWEAQTPISFPVTSVAGRTGAVTLSNSDISGVMTTTQGGTGQSGYTSGQLLIGTASGSLNKATLAAGSGVSIANGDGTITISAVGTGGTVTSVTTNSPLAISNSTTTPSLSIQSGTATGQTLRWSNAGWGVSSLNITDLRGSSLAQQLPTSCSASQVWVYQTPTDAYSCTAISINTSQVSGLGGAASLNVGTSSGTIAAGDDPRIVNAVQSGASAGGDLSGVFPSPRVARLQNTDLSSTAPTAGQVLTYNAISAKWEPQTVAGTSAVTSVAGRSGAVTLTAADISGTHSVAQGGTGQTSYSSGQLLVGTSAGSLAKTTLTAGSGVSIVNGDGTVTISATGSGGTVTSVSATSPLVVATGTSTPALSLQSGTSAGQTFIWNGTNWASTFANSSQLRSGAGLQQFPTTCSASQTLTYQSGNDTYVCSNIALSSSQVSGLGGAASLSVGTGAGSLAAGDDSRIVNAIQSNATVAGDLSGTLTSPSVAKIQGVSVSTTAPTAGQVLTYNGTTTKWEASTVAAAPVSSVAGRTGAVTLTTSDISGTLPVAQGGTGQTAYTSGQLLIGNAAGTLTKATLTAGTGVTLSNGDGAITINATGSGGTVTSVSAAAPLSVTNASTTPALSLQAGSLLGQGLRWGVSGWGIGFHNMSDLRSSGLAQQLPTNCTSAQVWAYQSPTDTYACTSIAVAASQVSGLGTAATLNVGTTSSTVAAGDDTRIVNSLQASDIGTSGKKVVALDSSNRLPAVDGSQLTNLPVTLPPFSNVEVIDLTGPATTSWTVPAGVKRVFVQVWGGGGGGAGGAGTVLTAIGGGGGGGGAYGAAFMNVTAGASIAVSVGVGGTAGAIGGSGGAGGTTSFSTITAGGGAGATVSVQIPSLGGVSTALLNIAGAKGVAAGVLSFGGAGGSAGGAGGGGGGGSQNGGNAGAAGTVPGGAGGGGGATIIASGGALGGAGAAGRIIVWY